MLSMSIALNAVLSSRRCATPGTIPRRCSSLRPGSFDLCGDRLRGIPLLQLVCCFAGPRVCRIDHEEGILRVCVARVGCFHYSCVPCTRYRLLCLNILYADTYSAVIGKIHLCTHPPRVQTFNWQYNKPLVDVAGLYLGHHVNCIHNCEYNPGL